MLDVGVRGGGWCVVAVVLLGVLWPAVCGIPRNTVRLVSPNGTRTTWWTRGNVGSWQPTSQLPLKVRITAAKLKRPSRRRPYPRPYAYTGTTGAAATGTATGTGTGTANGTGTATGTGTGTASCSTCGTSIINSNRGHNQVGLLPRKERPPPPVWPWSVSNARLNITAIEKGEPNSNSYLVYFERDDKPISPFHDIPLFANEGNKIFNMVVEIPRWTNEKMEIATKEPLNPIKQDVKKGKLRFVANVFPHHGYIWNYGALPQTWEDPSHVDESTGCKGDNDPIDVCEIGYRVAKRGDVLQVKILGIIALVDEGETDWKLIVIDVNDPVAPQLSDITDVEKHMPGYLKATVEWFRIYKLPDGKPENQFAFNGEAKNREFAHKIIMETHEHWQHLVEGKSDAGGLNTASVTVPNAIVKMSREEAEEVASTFPKAGRGQPTDPKVNLWHFLKI